MRWAWPIIVDCWFLLVNIQKIQQSLGLSLNKNEIKEDCTNVNGVDLSAKTKRKIMTRDLRLFHFVSLVLRVCYKPYQIHSSSSFHVILPFFSPCTSCWQPNQQRANSKAQKVNAHTNYIYIECRNVNVYDFFHVNFNSQSILISSTISLPIFST